MTYSTPANANGADPDLLCEMRSRIAQACPAVPVAVLDEIERGMREDFGGRRHFLRKGAYTKLSDDAKRVVFQEGLSTKSDADIMARHGISRRSLYRLMKRGPANE